jgi:GDP-D-mannose dehydratase
MTKTALVVGASGIVGSATTALLVEQGWTVHGLARRPGAQAGVLPVAAGCGLYHHLGAAG